MSRSSESIEGILLAKILGTFVNLRFKCVIFIKVDISVVIDDLGEFDVRLRVSDIRVEWAIGQLRT